MNVKPNQIRRSSIAGSWYPGTEAGLQEAVDTFLKKAGKPEVQGEVVGLMAPHAGYQYSGQVAAHAYKELMGLDFESVILLAPSHRFFAGEFAVTSFDYYETPLGLVRVDREYLGQLSGLVSVAKTNENLEHSLEIQLPFLQRTLGDFTLLPIMMGEQSLESCRTIGGAIAKIAKGQKALLLASSDLSHFYDYSTAVKLDKRVLERIETFDPEGLAKDLEARQCEACGGGPIVAVMLAARELGASAAKVLKYANSGDVTGDRFQVVGYAAGAVYRAG